MQKKTREGGGGGGMLINAMYNFFMFSSVSKFFWVFYFIDTWICQRELCLHEELLARRGGVEVAGWTVDRAIRVRFPAYPHRVCAL